MNNKLKEFRDYREKMNQKLLDADNKVIKRMFNLDTNSFMDGASSMVLRCDDCIKYHLEKCYSQKVTSEEIIEIFSIAILVGGTIVIPHTRRAMEFWEELLLSEKKIK